MNIKQELKQKKLIVVTIALLALLITGLFFFNKWLLNNLKFKPSSSTPSTTVTNTDF
jgi:uncharacterized protein YneF (UPF0154 family)